MAGLLPAAIALVPQGALAQAAEADPQDQVSAGTVAVPPPPPGAALPEVPPVIGDEEFNRAVPPLAAEDDPELDRPLESIAEFERRLAADQAGAEPAQGAAPPLGEPALADGTAREEIGDAPVRDVELVRALPPLDQFVVEPVSVPEPADGGEDAAPVRYRVVVEGLQAPDADADLRLRAMFDDLSALRAADGKAGNMAMISARLDEDRELVRRLLAAEGWHSPVITSRLDQPLRPGEPVSAVIAVVPGKRYVFRSIVIDAPPVVPPDLIERNLALRVGEPIMAERVQGAEAAIAVALPQNGYPFAEVTERSILLYPESGDGIYTLPINPGPRARFGDFASVGKQAFGVDHVAVLSRFRRGELYDERKVDDLRKALVATGLFSTVAVEPKRTRQDVGEGTEWVTMVVTQEAGPPRTLAATAGYDTGQGFRVAGSWTHRNLFPPEGALIAHGVAGTSEQGAGVTFRRSNAGKRDRSFEVVAEALHNDFDAYSAYTGRLAAHIARESTPIWQKRRTYALGVELLATAEKDYNPARLKRERRTFLVGGISGQIGFDHSDDLLDPTRGFRLTALVEPEIAFDGGTNPYLRARIDGSAYVPLGKGLVAAGRVRVGSIQGALRFEIPPSRRFYSGGGGSVRGFGYQALGPQDPDGDPWGGRSLNEASAELRYRFGQFGVVGFVDVGQSYESALPRFANLRMGAGIGGRFYTNFGPLRVDVATPIGRKPGESRFNLYVSIGQAF